MPVLLPRNQGLIKPLGSAVQIATNHHLAIGLRFAPIFNSGGGFKVWDPVKQQSMTFSTGATWTRGPHGPAMSFAGTAGQQATGTGLALNSRPWTVSAKYRVIIDEQHYWWTLGSVESTDAALHILDYFANGMDVNLFADDFHFNYSPKTLSEWMHLHITQDSSKVISLYKNGVLLGTQTAAGMFSGNGDWTLAARTVGGTDYFKGDFDHLMLWDRALSAKEVQDHFAGPYRMFAAPVWRRYFVPSAAAPVGKSVRILQAVKRAGHY